MVKVEVIEKFSLKAFGEIKNLTRGTKSDKYGELYVTDTFECDEKMAKYLTGDNALKKVVVKVIEVEPKKDSKVICEDKEVEKLFEEKPKKKKGKK